ncbi:kelch-like protein 10 [Electrophorus electricus]|uniref:kelch-like protein 10 n=1 Tax=Electrophorus electricus TaxID=8005 RepID=UPI0015CF8F27|nr:kelch-like protein 10 [Electrophorus electricus]
MSAMACTVYNELCMEGKLCDVVLKINDVEINAHKIILCGSSDYFRLSEILENTLRMALMMPDHIMNNVKDNAVVKDSEDCKPFIINALRTMNDLNMNGPSNTDFRNPLAHPRLPYTILLAIGGWSDGSPTNGGEAYDARADLWVNITQEEESPRAYHVAAYVNGLVYCVGGFDRIDYFSSVRKFNPETRTWHQVAPMHSQRCYISVAVLNGCIYAMGGFDGHVRLNTAERYDPVTNQWTRIAPMHERRSDASATTLHGKAAFSLPHIVQVVDELFFVIGGYNGFITTCNVEYYDWKMEHWYEAHDMSILQSASSCCSVPTLPNVLQYAAPRDLPQDAPQSP